jgi:hypothetical protein
MFSSVLWFPFNLLINERSQTVPYSGTPSFLHSRLWSLIHTDSSHDADATVRSRRDTRTTETLFYSISFSNAPTTRLHQPENSISIRFGSFVRGVSQPLIFLFPKCRDVLPVGLTECISSCRHEILVVSERVGWYQCNFVVTVDSVHRLGCLIFRTSVLNSLTTNCVFIFCLTFVFKNA